MDTYYKKVKQVNANGGGWAGIYYGIVSKFINDNGIKKCLEIGIGYGLHAKEILENTKIQDLTLVDPMMPYDPNDGFHKDVMNNGGFEALVTCIKKELEPYKDRYNWIRKPSYELTNEDIKDGSMDLIFVDGDHRYKPVLNDLELSWKKIRSGGFILGDDYWMKDVKKAVDEFSAKHNVPLSFIKSQGGSQPGYKIFLLKKN